ncbi:MAG: CPBP family intramembrane glutamic endopeptidase [Sedimentisphaeraceae bacterium JB056]
MGKKTSVDTFETYFERTSKPIYAFYYLLFFVVVYELGLFAIDSEVFSRPLGEVPGVVVAFAWVYNTLIKLGFNGQGAWVGAPVVVMATLIVWQLASNTEPKVRIRDFFPMTLECIGWSIPLIAFSFWINNMVSASDHAAVPAIPQASLLASTENTQQFFVSVIAGIGAGIYEELFFRLYVIMVLVLFMRKFLGMPELRANCFAIVISALLFSAHHHVYFLNGSFHSGEPFSVVPFIFRFIAGVYLAALFGIRGFGVVAATHAYHNILAAMINYM